MTGVRAVILDVDTKQRRLSLGLKPSYFADAGEAKDEAHQVRFSHQSVAVVHVHVWVGWCCHMPIVGLLGLTHPSCVKRAWGCKCPTGGGQGSVRAWRTGVPCKARGGGEGLLVAFVSGRHGLTVLSVKSTKLYSPPKGSTQPLVQAAKMSHCDSGRPKVQIPVVTSWFFILLDMFNRQRCHRPWHCVCGTCPVSAHP